LLRFSEAGYLGYHETLLEFPHSQTIPETLRGAATWADPEDSEPG
jgi:hypothetical protein